MICRS